MIFLARVSGNDNTVDLALGRITCANPGEANAMVNKIIDYELNQERGDWRNLITLISDDGLKSDGTYEGALTYRTFRKFGEYLFPKII